MAGDKIRFKRVSDKSLPQVMRGWEDLFDHTLGGYLEGRVRALHVYQDLDGQNQLIAASEKAVYAYTGALLWPITPLRSFGNLATNFSVTSGSNEVTINESAHGCLLGDIVFFNTVSAVGGISLGRNGSGNNAITVSNKSRLLVFEIAGHGLQTGSRIEIAGASGIGGVPASDINKRHTVYRATDDIFQIFVDTKATSDVAQSGGSFTYAALTKYEVTELTSANSFKIQAEMAATSTTTGGGASTHLNLK